MHASNRSLKPGDTLANLRPPENAVGYAAVLQPGEIGQGLNDFGGSWVAVSPDGNATSGSASSAPSSGGYGGY